MVTLEVIDEVARCSGFVRTVASSVSPELSEALEELANQDALLLKRGAAERAICHRLAVYLESSVNHGRRDDERLHVDCEYNLFGSDVVELQEIDTLHKRMPVEGRDDKPGIEQVHSVYPDLIVHRRDTKTNLLVIEMKVLRTSTKRKDVEFDFRKLVAFHRPDGSFSYREAVFILVIPDELTQDGALDRIVLYATAADEVEVTTHAKDLTS